MGLKKTLFGLSLAIASMYVQAKDVVLAALEYPPHYGEHLDNYGPLIEIIVSAYAEEGLEVEVLFLPWSRALIWADEGRVDGIVGAWYTQERTKSFLYSKPIYPNKMIFYKSANSDIAFTTFADLKEQNRVIGSVRGYAHVEGLEESGVMIHYVNNDIQNFKLLERQRIDLVSVDKDYGAYVLASPELSKIKDKVEPINKVLQVKQQHLIISKKTKLAQQKLTKFNQGLAKLKERGGIAAIMKKHGLLLSQN